MRRTPGQVCPSHPKPLPQELINHRVIVPDVIKKALNQLEQWIGMNVQQRDIGALSVFDIPTRTSFANRDIPIDRGGV